MDFFIPSKKITKGITHISPKFKIVKSKDLMIRGRDFYAIWDEERGVWSKDQDEVIRLIDNEIRNYISKNKSDDEAIIGDYMWDADSGVIDKWNKYVSKQLRDNYTPLDNRIIFSNTVVKREDYSTHRLDYPLEACPIPAYEEFISTLYDPDERKKLEWAIGCIVSGDSTWVQKFVVIVGEPKTGKSSFFKLIRMLFKGYLATINAKALGDGHSAFALEPLKNDPLVAIEDDADLSRITDNTRLNSLVSHEPMTVNEKFKAQYENSFKAFIFLGSNKDVKITDSSSGLTRRLIDVVPSGRRLDFDRYNEVMAKLPFELGGIAHHCLQVYYHNKKKYNDYIPVRMLRATNLIYNFLEEYHKDIIREDGGARFHDLWNNYQKWCEFGKIQFSHNRQEFRNELRPYFKEYFATYEYEPGQMCNGYFKGFKYEKFGYVQKEEENENDNSFDIPDWLKFGRNDSALDAYLKDYPAQLTKEDGTPKVKWVNCNTTLKDISTNNLHYVKCPENLICIDFDIKDEKGNKDREANLKAASVFPKTYGEYSKSGAGIHLHYIYKGDANKLSRLYDNDIEIKVFQGDSSLRRQLTECNDISIAEISSGLPLKGESKMVNTESLANEKALRTVIKKNLLKEYHPNTAPSVSFIKKVLDDAYTNDISYDVSDLEGMIIDFAMGSSHQTKECLKMVDEMKFKSKDKENEPDSEENIPEDSPIIFYDIETFINVFIVCYKLRGKENKTQSMINPTGKDIERLYSLGRLIGFNNRGYDAHILWGRMMGYTNEQLYSLSQKIIHGEGNDGKFSEAYRSDYADIYDYSTKKQSLKKWEIELSIHHVENSIPWDKPVPEDRISELVEYCKNDVEATERVFEETYSDFKVRLMISKLTGLPPIDTNRQHGTKFIFGNEKHPNLVYTDLRTGKRTFMDGTEDNSPAPINSFPDYRFNKFGFDKTDYKDGICTSRKSIYMGEDPSEGGFVFAVPGMYYNVVCFDVGGMHPASIIAMNKLGEYTKRYKELRDMRIAIKHKDYDTARQLLDGEFAEFLNSDEDAKDISKALKLILNSLYGWGAATFQNPFKDPRDEDNIVAKRGALFMITLKNEVIKRGYKVIHCKTDSIKVVNPDKEISDFIFEFGRKYGYEFEIEHVFKKICLVNRSTYIGQYEDRTWDATGAEFAEPYIYKTLFTHEPLTLDDYQQTKSASVGELYLDMSNDEDVEKIEELEKERKKLEKKGMASEVSLIDEELNRLHNYIFIGRVSSFVPVKSGGGTLVVKRSNGYSSVSGTKGYRFLETEVYRRTRTLDDIDISFYRKLADDAIADIEKYGYFDMFVKTDDDATYPF